MTRAAFLAALVLLPVAGAFASGPGEASIAPFPGAVVGTPTTAPGGLSSPGDYSLAPATSSILPPVAGGVASTAFGSNGMRSSSLEFDSGLIGSGTHAFLSVGAGQGPRWHDAPAVSGQSVAAGVSTALPFGTTLTVTGGFENDRISDRSGVRTGSLP